MVYILFLFFVCLFYSIQNREYHTVKSILQNSIPVIFFGVLLIGGQYGVGTDYFSYLSYFASSDLSYFIDRGDIGFANFVMFCRSIGIEGQGFFFLLSFIWIILLLLTFKFLLGSKTRFLGYFFFVFIVYSTSFNNQMNGIRQYTSIYMLSFALCLCFQRKWILSFGLLICSILNHKSSLILALVFTLFYFLNERIFKRKWLYLIVIGGFICSLLLNVGQILPFLGYLQGEDMFSEYTVYYNNLHSEGSDFLEKATKYIYIPLYFISIYKLPKMQLQGLENKLFVIGIISFSFKMAILSLPYISRLGQYFEILMCIPLVYLLIFYRKSKIGFVVIYTYLLFPYLLKVTFLAKAEYLYDSYFLQYF